MSLIGRFRALFVLCALGFVAGCASPPTASPSTAAPVPPVTPPVAAPATYSESERARLGLCAGMSDNAFSVAHRKLAGVPAGEVRKLYEGKPGMVGQLMPAMVDKIYSDKFEHEWDYTISFFAECTQQMTPVPRERIGLASYCMQNRLIAAVAVAARDSGRPKDTAYQMFAAFKADAPRKIVDDVYAHPGSLAEAESAIWEPCISSHVRL